MRVIVNGRATGIRIYEADGWKIGEGDILNVLQNGEVVATHAPGTWETVHILEGRKN